MGWAGRAKCPATPVVATCRAAAGEGCPPKRVGSQAGGTKCPAMPLRCGAVRCGAARRGRHGVVWCGVVCRRRCYQMAMAGMVLHTVSVSREGCVSKRALCVVCGAPVAEGHHSPWCQAAAAWGCPVLAQATFWFRGQKCGNMG